MKAKMNARERPLAAIGRKPVDFVPCAPFFNPLTPAQRFGYRWQFPFGPSEEEMARYCVEELGVGPAVALPTCTRPLPLAPPRSGSFDLPPRDLVW